MVSQSSAIENSKCVNIHSNLDGLTHNDRLQQMMLDLTNAVCQIASGMEQFNIANNPTNFLLEQLSRDVSNTKQELDGIQQY